MSGSVWASVIVMATVLALILRGQTLQRLPRGRILAYGAVWAAIIVVLALIAGRLAA